MSYNQHMMSANEASWGFAFAQRLTRIFRDRGIKTAQFARQTGLPESTIKAALRGSTIPNYYRMTLIADGLGMSVEKLTDLRPFADLDDLVEDEDELQED